MAITTRKQQHRSRLGEIGHTASVRTAEAGHKVREEFDDVAPKVTAAASDVLHSVAHTAAERSRPVRAEAASRGSAALSGLLGEVTPAQIEKLSGRAGRGGARRTSRTRSGGKRILLLSAIGGAVWFLWHKRSDPNLNPWLEEVSESDTSTVNHADGFVGP